MERRLGTIDRQSPENRIDFGETITEVQYAQYRKSVSEIEELHSNRRLVKIVLLNEKDFFSYLEPTLKELMKKSDSLTGMDRKDGEQKFLNINRLLLNYLSSIRTFLDHSETVLNRKFGNTSNQFLEFKRMLSFFYDNSFAYRFFFKLRNYSQHCGLPLSGFHFSIQPDRIKREIRGELYLVFKRDKLLTSYDAWGKVAKDLQAMKEEFDVQPLVIEMTHNITEIGRNIELLNAEQVISSASFIRDLTKHLRTENVEVCIFSNIESRDNGQVVNFNVEHIPFETIDLIE